MSLGRVRVVALAWLCVACVPRSPVRSAPRPAVATVAVPAPPDVASVPPDVAEVTTPVASPSPPTAPAADAAWNEFRTTGTAPRAVGDAPHPPAWCFRGTPLRAPSDEVVSCHPTEARCREVRGGELGGASAEHEPVRIGPCAATASLWCVATGGDFRACRSTRALCEQRLASMARASRAYRDGRRCEERWAQ